MALEDLLKTKRELIATFDLSDEEATELLSINKNLYKEELKTTLNLTDQQAAQMANVDFNERERNEQQQTEHQRPVLIRRTADQAVQPINLNSLGLTLVPTIAATVRDININRSSSRSTHHSSGSHSSSYNEYKLLNMTYQQQSTSTFSNANSNCFYRAIAVSKLTTDANLNQEIVRLRDLAVARVNASNQPDPSNIQALIEYTLHKSGILNNNSTTNLSNSNNSQNITLTTEELAQQTNNQAANIDNTPLIGELQITELMQALERPICIIKSNNSVSIIENTTAANQEPLFVYYHVNNNHYDGLTVNPGANAREILNNLRNYTDAPRPNRLRRTI